ncbi:MAG: serine hydrolase [Thermoguttaceae bacterium]|nr:serine hydrolase [Thermoguttaceae bacterium]
MDENSITRRNILQTVSGVFLGSALSPFCFSQESVEKSTANGQSEHLSKDPIAAALQPFVDAGQMPGFVTMVADRERVLQTNAVGWADLEAKRPMREDTLFWIASMSKTFCAVAVMMLVDEGKMTLDDPISRFFPEFSQLKVAVSQENGDVRLVSPIAIPTVRQVLSHTAGWPFKTPYMIRFGNDSLPLERKIQTFVNMPLESQPGTKYQYSNIGIDCAAAIVENVSGQKYEDFLRQRIWMPLGMTQTTYRPTEERLTTNYAYPYCWNAEQNKLERTTIYALTYPLYQVEGRFADAGGGIFSTAGDVTKFYQMFLRRGEYDGKPLLSPAAVDEISRKQTGGAVDTSYGLAVSVSERSFGHGGAYATDGLVYPQDGYVAIYMVQVTGVPKQNEAKTAFNHAAHAAFEQKR